MIAGVSAGTEVTSTAVSSICADVPRICSSVGRGTCETTSYRWPRALLCPVRSVRLYGTARQSPSSPVTPTAG